MGPLDMPEEIEGAACETLLFQELKAINDSVDLGYTLYYWKTSNNIEVDFILYGKRGIKAFEIKRTRRISKSMLRGLTIFLKDYPMAKAYFVYGGKRYMKQGAIEILPMENTFRQLRSILESE